MSQSTQLYENEHCCDTNPDYSITYKINDTIRKNIICKDCIKSQKIFDDNHGKLLILQLNIKEIICIHCNQNVTKTKGCVACKTVFEEKKTKQ